MFFKKIICLIKSIILYQLSIKETFYSKRDVVMWFGESSLYITTISGAAAAVNGIEFLIKRELKVKSLQEYHSFLQTPVWGQALLCGLIN